MIDVFRMIGVCLLVVMLAQLLKGTNPTGSFAIILCGVLLFALWGLNGVHNVVSELDSLVSRTGLQSELYIPVIKVIGIAAAVQISGAVCKDAGASALALQLEIMGTCAALIVCLPLFEQVLVVADALLD